LGFRTNEILSDLGLRGPLEDKIKGIMEWTNFNYKSHVLGLEQYERVHGRPGILREEGDYTDVTTLGKVNHFQWMAKNKNQPIPSTKEDYLRMIEDFRSEPRVSGGGFTYAFPNHLSQNILAKALKDNLTSLD
jgi:hypothetical protein